RHGVGKVTYAAKALKLARWADVVVLQKPHQPEWLVDAVRRLAPVMVDIDDAMWAPISPAPSHVEQAREREARLRHALAASRAVMTGSAYLEAWVRERLTDVLTQVVPPALDVAHYSMVEHGERSPVVVGWIGSPVNFGDLEVV